MASSDKMLEIRYVLFKKLTQTLQKYIPHVETLYFVYFDSHISAVNCQTFMLASSVASTTYLNTCAHTLQLALEECHFFYGLKTNLQMLLFLFLT